MAGLPSGHLSFQTVAARPRTRNPLATERRFTSAAPGPALACPALYQRRGQNPPLRHGCHRDATIIRIVVDIQIAAAKSRGLLNREPSPPPVTTTRSRFYLGAILDKESGGRNIFDHDQGGALSGPAGTNVEVTEERYREFPPAYGGRANLRQPRA